MAPAAGITAAEAVAYLSALDATDRTACERWVRAQRVDKSLPGAAQEARERFQELQLLGDPLLVSLARRVIASSLSHYVGDSTPLHATCWRGKYDIGDEIPGTQVDSTWGEFVAWLCERAEVVAPKGEGVVCCPTRNPSGRRVNEATLAMTALNLDCDSRGEWDALLGELAAVNLAHVAYQSGGWSSTLPKWHVLIAIAREFDTSSPERIDAWKAIYKSTRVLIGALAALRGDGFDPTIETPCTPVFVTERREATHPLRQVIWSPGRALDLDAFAAALPAVEADDVPSADRGRCPTQTIDDARHEQILSALMTPMSKILSGRRDLYMALPGALLDRGVAPNDVRALVEELSNRCPGDSRYTRAEVASRHKQHMHDCETTIRCYDRDDKYTRIGTLNKSWPEVAHAIDAVLPDLTLAAVEERSKKAFARVTLLSETAASSGAVVSIPAGRSVSLAALRVQLVQLRRKKTASKNLDEKIRGVMLGALLDGEDLVPRYEDPETGESKIVLDGEKSFTREGALRRVAAMVGGKLPTGTLFEHVQEFFRRSVYAMLVDGESSAVLMGVAKGAFLHAVKKKFERDDASRAKGERMSAAIDAVSDIIFDDEALV